MAQITPVNFNNMAADMFRSLANNAPTKRTYIRNFYRAANESATPGNALIAYYTELNKLSGKNTYASAHKVVDALEKEINQNPILDEEFDKFVHKLADLYPKTLENRVYAASNGTVVSDRVEPKSKFKKFIIFLSKFLTKEE